ncbi:MAG: hypothetical protein Q8Q35_03910 [Nanoarchaeota archaeon]|nr:hypothetical protein [Nanoarchaeota archaeon]
MKKVFILILLFSLSLTSCSNEDTIIESNLSQDSNLSALGSLIVCGDYNCDNSENHASCPEDCKWADISELALDIEDFPEGFKIDARGPRDKTEISKTSLELGWKEGYFVRIIGFGDNSAYNSVGVEQYISIYPIDKISGILDDIKENIKEGTILDAETNSRITYTELEDLNIGDDSLTYKLTEEDLDWDYIFSIYCITFIKEEVYMNICSSDYELLKDVAYNSEKKI